MTVRSNTEQPLNYQAFIAKNEKKKGKRTSVCTLLPGVMMNESWPAKIPGIRLKNFEPAGPGMTCK